MASPKRTRRKLRRKAPAVRRAGGPGPAPAARGSAASDLVVGGAMDPAEKAADHMADRALSGRAPAINPPVSSPTAAVHRKCADCAKEDKDKSPLQRAPAAPTPRLASGTAAAPAPKTAATAVGAMAGGRRMTRGERSFFEPRFGRDFGAVRIHEGPAAATATRALGARAFAKGSEIAFAPGQRDTRTMAHELAHVVQDDGALRRLDNCTSKTAESAVITNHALDSPKIFEPGDKAKATVTFGCRPKSFRSRIVDSSGNSLRTTVVQGKSIPTSGKYTYSWTGEKGFPKVGTFMADDGKYKHRISDVVYAYASSGNKMINAGNTASESSEIEVSTRRNVNNRRATAAEKAGSGKDLVSRENHYVDSKGAVRQDNIDTMASAMRSEAGIGNSSEQEAVAWAIKNGMVRVNSYKVSDANSAIPFATNQTGTASDITAAQDILRRPMSDDKAGGAIKWYSPRAMPPNNKNASCKEGEGKAKKMDCSGGKVTLTDKSNPAGKNDYSYAPAFHKNMTFVDIAGVRQWNFRFYKL